MKSKQSLQCIKSTWAEPESLLPLWTLHMCKNSEFPRRHIFFSFHEDRNEQRLCKQVLPIRTNLKRLFGVGEDLEMGRAVNLMVELLRVGQNQLILHAGVMANTWNNGHKSASNIHPGRNYQAVLSQMTWDLAAHPCKEIQHKQNCTAGTAPWWWNRTGTHLDAEAKR